jgi:hypothetical protein
MVEALVTISVVAALCMLVLGALPRLRMKLKMLRAHSDLRQVTMVLHFYQTDHNGECPPTRFSCSSGLAYPLPVELLEYGLPRGRNDNGAEYVALDDPFTPGEGYRYRAPGRAILNETTFVENAARLWIPENFPRHPETEDGQYISDPKQCPVRYAVWSMGPDPQSPKFAIPGRLPVPRKYWMENAGDTGVVVHMEKKEGGWVMSP